MAPRRRVFLPRDLRQPPVPSTSLWKGVIEQYRKYLPVTHDTPIITLLEGNTPLIPSPVLSRMVGRDAEVYLKYEGMNPTGSFKDRGMTLAITKAVEAGSQAVMCASTGNTSASASAYAARAGLKSIVLIPSGAIALGKLSQALIHEAQVAAIDANFDECLKLARDLVSKFPITLVNSINPHRIEGQKTCAFEICDALGRAPDLHVVPVGNAGNITSQWKGYQEYHANRITTHVPVMAGFQAAGAAPIVKGKAILNPKTVATAIRIGNPASWQGAVNAAQQSDGLIDAVTDREILHAYQLIASQEGVFAEPASAASVAGLLSLVKRGYFKTFRAKGGGGPVIVCTLTGHGLKDPERAIKSIRMPPRLKPSVQAVSKALSLR